jgi:hypothetical protein
MELAWHACPATRGTREQVPQGLLITLPPGNCCHGESSAVGVSETVLAAMIGAGATLVTALFQVISSFRAASAERRSSKRGSGVRSLMWTVALILAAGVGGFAYAEFRSQQSRDETRALRTELQAQMQALQASTARLEQMRFTSAPTPGGTASGAASNAAMVTLPACKGPQVGFATQRLPCTEQDALQVAVCTPVPASAQVTSVELFSRGEDAQTPWQDAHVQAGQESGNGRFADTRVEREDGEQVRLVCQSYSHWGEKPRAVRILVRYAAGQRTPG